MSQSSIRILYKRNYVLGIKPELLEQLSFKKCEFMFCHVYFLKYHLPRRPFFKGNFRHEWVKELFLRAGIPACCHGDL